MCGPAIVRNTQPKVASGENNESTFLSGQISVQVAHVSADRVRQNDVAVKGNFVVRFGGKDTAGGESQVFPSRDAAQAPREETSRGSATGWQLVHT